MNSVTEATSELTTEIGVGFGKVILLGEHAVVYGSHALAAPIALAIQASVQPIAAGVEVAIPAWGLQKHSYQAVGSDNHLDLLLSCLFGQLDLNPLNIRLVVQAHIPRASGLGGSAALAVALIRALDYHYQLKLCNEKINQVAFECEKIAHGTPSGVDNTMATWGKLLLFKRGEPPLKEVLTIPQPISLVIGFTGQSGSTAEQVAKLRQQKMNHPAVCERLFTEIDGLVLAAKQAILTNDLKQLGELMNICQGLLNALQASTWQLEQLIQIARANGAMGAKLTGAGGGGAMIALCPDNEKQVIHAMQQAGYQAMGVTIGQ